MHSETVYQKLKEKLNKNFTNGTVALDRARAVYLFNEEQNKFVEFSLQQRRNFDGQDIQQLLERKKLKQHATETNFTSFTLPEDFFSFVNIEASASLGECTGRPLLLFQVKPENVHELLNDENNKPSFKYGETFYTVEGNKVKVYTDGFDIDKLFLNYYRYPVQLNLKGYIDIDGKQSFSQDPEFSDRIVDRIISMCATSFDINNENLNKVQFDINRVTSKI